MAPRKANSVAARVGDWLTAHPEVDRITDAVIAEMLAALEGVKPDSLRKALRTLAIDMDPLVEGVRQESYEQLFRTLCALEVEYEDALGDDARRRRIRSLVIEAKTHARFAAARAGRDSEKHEMVEWMLVWLRDPSLFSTWARLRISHLGLRLAGANPHPSDVTEPDAGETDSD